MHPSNMKVKNDTTSSRPVTSDEDEAHVVPIKTFNVESQPIKLLSKSQIKRRERGEARFAKYMAKLSNGGIKVTQTEANERVDSEHESESEEDSDEGGYETTSSID